MFHIVTEFERNIAHYFGAPYAIAFDSCTHGIEVCLRYTNANKINVPKRTYISIPFLANKIGFDRDWETIKCDSIWSSKVMRYITLKFSYYMKHIFVYKGLLSKNFKIVGFHFSFSIGKSVW